LFPLGEAFFTPFFEKNFEKIKKPLISRFRETNGYMDMKLFIIIIYKENDNKKSRHTTFYSNMSAKCLDKDFNGQIFPLVFSKVLTD